VVQSFVVLSGFLGNHMRFTSKRKRKETIKDTAHMRNVSLAHHCTSASDRCFIHPCRHRYVDATDRPMLH